VLERLVELQTARLGRAHVAVIERVMTLAGIRSAKRIRKINLVGYFI
jgi:hypothetical protein